MNRKSHGVESERYTRVRAGDVPGSPARLVISAAQPGDAPAIAALLCEARLPNGDFARHLAHFFVARDKRGLVIAAAGAEVHAPDALLRSVVVAEARHGEGIGDELMRR